MIQHSNLKSQNLLVLNIREINEEKKGEVIFLYKNFRKEIWHSKAPTHDTLGLVLTQVGFSKFYLALEVPLQAPLLDNKVTLYRDQTLDKMVKCSMHSPNEPTMSET